MINLSPNAIAEINRLKSSSDQHNHYLRIKVCQGGCAELLYKLQLDNQFQQGDRQFHVKNSDVIIITDSSSFEYIENLTIDYTEDLMGGAFQFKNPQALKQCTCGISFAVKE